MGGQMIHQVGAVAGALGGGGLVLAVVHATVVLGHALVVAAAVVPRAEVEMIVEVVAGMILIAGIEKRAVPGLEVEPKVVIEVDQPAKAPEMKVRVIDLLR